jgi:phosphatidate cytidylyltransferase
LKEEIAVRLLWTLGSLFAIAGAGVGIHWAWRGRRAGQSRMGTRFGLEVLFLAAIWLPAYWGGPWLLGAVLALGLLCARELYGTFERGGESPWPGWGGALGVLILLIVYLRPGVIGWLFPLLVILYQGLRWGALAHPESILPRMRSTAFGLLYPFACLAFFLELGLREDGFGYAILFYGICEAQDSAGYLVGSSIGRRRIFPRLSPGKTAEGVAGGILFAIAVAFAFSFAVPEFDSLRLAAAAILIACAGLAGDLFASRLKRRAGVKDYGDLIPTQGGVLDVYDAFIFVAPVFYYFLELTGSG